MSTVRRLVRRRTASDEGFSLIEAAVSMLIFALIAASLAGMTVADYAGSASSRLSQQASNVAQAAIESARALPWSNLTMSTTDLTGDSTILTSCNGVSGYFVPVSTGTRCSANGSVYAEPLVSVATGAGINPHVATTTLTGHVFTVKTYVSSESVTLAGSTGADRRVTVMVSWTDRGKARSFVDSWLDSGAKSGLQLPNFTTVVSSACTQPYPVNPGNTGALAFTITNSGAIDTYDISMTAPSGRTWPVSLYLDNGHGDCTYHNDDPALTDTNGDSAVDTGDVAAGTAVTVIAVFTVPSTDAPATSLSYTFNALSGTSQALSASVTKTASATVKVSPENEILYLHNYPTPPTASTTTADPTTASMTMDLTAPTATTLFPYSNDSQYATTPGRYLSSSGATKNKLVTWWYQMPSSWTIGGTGNGTVKVALTFQSLQCNLDPKLVFSLYDAKPNLSANQTLLSNVSATSTPGTGTGPCVESYTYTLTSTLAQFVIPINDYLELKIVDTSGVLLYYDTTAYPSSLTVTRVS